jgi:hypothetical protein
MRLLLHILGIDSSSSYWYGFWSGFGGDLTIFAAVIVWLRHKNCHVKGCPRLGRHPVEGSTWTVCRRHHPDGHPTHADVLGVASKGAIDADR